MRAVQLMGVVGALVLLMGWGGVSPARSELRAVVEDSTTIVVTRGDSVVFRKEMGFARHVSSWPMGVSQPGFGAVAVWFDYAPMDTIFNNPLPFAYTYKGSAGSRRSHLLLVDERGDEVLSADIPFRGLSQHGLALLSPDTLFVLYEGVGEAIQVDMRSGVRKTVRFSEEGYGCGPDEPCLPGWVVVLRRDLVMARSDLGTMERGILSEIALVGAAGSLHWRRAYPGKVVENLAIDTDTEVILVELYAPVESARALAAISPAGDALWARSLESPGLRRRLEAGGGVVRVSPPPQVLDSRTGALLEGQP